MTPTSQTRPRFGTPDSVDPQRLFKMPIAMQAEGVRLLFEMGQSMDQVKARIGLSAAAINQILDKARPFPRGGDASVIAEGV